MTTGPINDPAGTINNPSLSLSSPDTLTTPGIDPFAGTRSRLESLPAPTDARYVRGLGYRQGFTNGAQGQQWNPPNVADLATAEIDVTVSGARPGDPAIASFSGITNGWRIYAYVTAADTVRVVLENKTGGAVDLASGTLRVGVFSYN